MAIVVSPFTAPTSAAPDYAPSQPDRLAEFQEKIVAAMAFGVTFLPYLDPYTEETIEIKAAYRKMIRSPVVKAGLLQKVYSVASQDLQVAAVSDSPRDQDAAEFVRYAYTDAIEGGAGGLPRMAEAILLPFLIDGKTVAERVWYKEPWQRGRWRGKQFYRDFKSKDTDQLTLNVDKFLNITSVTGRGEDGRYHDFPASDFIIGKHLAMFDGPGSSDLRAAYSAWWTLETLETLHRIHLGKFNGPFIVGTFGDGQQTTLERNIKNAKGNSWVVIPEGSKIELMNFVLAGDAFLAKCKDLKENIAIAITGAILTMLTSGSSGQMRGSSETQQGTSDLFTWILTATFCGFLNTQATPALIRENFMDLDYPKVSLGGINIADLLEIQKLLTGAQDAGAPLSKKAYGKALSLQYATTPDDILTPVPKAPAFGVMPGGFPGSSTGLPAGLPASSSTAGSQDALAATGDVQGAALNGAQISSLLDVVDKLATKALPPPAVIAILEAAFPAMDPATIQKIAGSISAQPGVPIAPVVRPAPAFSGGRDFFPTGRLAS